MTLPFKERPSWLKSRGYLHITPKIDVFTKYIETLSMVQNENYVARHGFLPLIHSVIKERKFKKSPLENKERAHTHKIKGKHKKTAKLRPLHYATHIDSMIFGYYAALLLKLYEDELDTHKGLSECVIAYRKIDINEFEGEEFQEEVTIDEEKRKGKGTIHFAHEAFEEIKSRALDGCIVMMFDIKSFFSEIDHGKLKEAWCKLLQVDRLDHAHFNVFNAATNFRYILKDELRIKSAVGGKRAGFDERRLANIRKFHGKEAFFSSIKEFSQAIKDGEVKVYKHPFVKERVSKNDPSVKKKIPVGIPQGLPISAVLANLYLLEFDKLVLDKVVNQSGGFYRRYSDDIMIVCKPEQANDIEDFILNAILDSNVEISKEKTEKFLFKQFQVSPRKKKIVSILLSKNRSDIGKPLTYLGFEFYGDKTLIKSANLAKFYRRMILTARKKAKRAVLMSRKTQSKPVVFRGRLKRVYSILKLESEKQFTKRKKLIKTSEGYYSTVMEPIELKGNRTNYFSYIKRASLIMEEPAINAQVINHRRIFNEAISNQLKKERD